MSTMAVLLAIVGSLVILPLIAMFWGATRTSLIGNDQQFTWHALELVYTSGPYLRTLGGTIGLALLVAAISSIMGAMFAWLMNRTDMPGRRFNEILVMAPLFLSPFIGAVAWITLAAPNSGILNVAARQLTGMEGPLVDIMTLPGMIWVLTLYYTPYGYLFVSAALKNMDPSLEEASHISGAGILTTVRRVTYPLSWPAIASSFFFIAVLATGIFSVPGVLGVRAGFVPLAVRLYQAIQGFPADYAVAAAIGTILFWFTLAGIWMYRRSVRLSHRYVTVTARGYRPRLVSLGKFKWLAVGACALYSLLAVMLPYAALTIVSFTPYAMRDLTQLEFSSIHFQNVLTAPNVLEAMTNTLTIAVIAPTLCVLLGIVVAYAVNRQKAPGSRFLEYVSTLPIAIPGIVFGTGMIWLYIRTPLYATLTILVVAYVATYLPHSLRLTSNGLMQIDRALEEASTINGASNTRTMRKITLPLSKPAMLSAWIMIFIFTVREINTAIVLYSPRTNVLSVMTWDFVQGGRIAQAAVVGLLQTFLLIAGVLIARFMFRVKLTSTGV